MSFSKIDDFKWNKLSVLIVDDSMFFRNLVSGVLHAIGVQKIEVTSDAVDAFRILQSTSIDIALVDYIMDPLNGSEFTQMIRTSADSPAPELPIIMVTGDATQATLNDALSVGVNDFLAKPISANTLLGRIQRVISDPVRFVRRPGYYGPVHGF